MCKLRREIFFLSEPGKHLCGTPTKQGTSDILGIMSFWYHCKEHTFNFIPKSSPYSSYFLRYNHLSGSVILRNLPLKFPIPRLFNLTGCRKYRIFCGKMFENQSEYMAMIKDVLQFVKKKSKKKKQKSEKQK